MSSIHNLYSFSQWNKKVQHTFKTWQSETNSYIWKYFNSKENVPKDGIYKFEREKAKLHVKIGRCDSQLYPLILLNTSFLNGIVVNRTLFYWGVFWNKAYRLSLCSVSVALSLRDVFRNLSKGGGLKFFLFPGRGTQHPFGPENPPKSIYFTGPGGGLAPIAPLNTLLISLNNF